MNRFTYILLALMPYITSANNADYSRQDSIRITHILAETSEKNFANNSELIITIAGEFSGTPYVGGTLDRSDIERVTVNSREMDCTTFVEQVVAIAATYKEGKKDFASFIRNLERIRYRDGLCNGYTSRLHYISQWIADSAKSNLIEEKRGEEHTATQILHLDFMSKHPDNYRQLKENPHLIEEIARCEAQFNGAHIAYIPKNSLQKPQEQLQIEDGDILALVTNIKGLDVSHIGFAIRRNGQLHLLHASSAKGKIVNDEQPLYDYLKNRKSNPGIRVFRFIK